jgi:putative ABC transport system permease protein
LPESEFVLGLGGAWALSRPLESFLSGVKAHDPVVFIVVPVVLGAAVWIPARRASRVDPIDVLRWE